jgi:hypothetical protein
VSARSESRPLAYSAVASYSSFFKFAVEGEVAAESHGGISKARRAGRKPLESREL